MQQYLKDGQAKLLKVEAAAANLTAQYEKAVMYYNDFVAKLELLTKSVEAAGLDKMTELESKINAFIAKSETLENNIAGLANKVAQVNKDFEVIWNNAKKAKHNLEVYKANYLKEKERLEPEIAKLTNELAVQKTKVDAVLLKKYNAKSDGKMFPIFVAETSGKCGGCSLDISASRLSDLKNKGVIECENCGRLIYKK